VGSVPKVAGAKAPKPASAVPATTPAAAAPPLAAASPAVVVPPPAAAPEPAAAQPDRADSNQPVFWSWPADGRLIRGYDANSTGKKGIDIAGNSGDTVRAAAAGKVVYAGDGLTGYGRLIIIKHNKDFLSAYAHNRKLIAKEGQWVNKGEVIAQMGSSGTDRTQLHFEIRRQGRPVDPLGYLPKR
jgi:lipoprotein NlpD